MPERLCLAVDRRALGLLPRVCQLIPCLIAAESDPGVFTELIDTMSQGVASVQVNFVTYLKT